MRIAFGNYYAEVHENYFEKKSTMTIKMYLALQQLSIMNKNILFEGLRKRPC